MICSQTPVKQRGWLWIATKTRDGAVLLSIKRFTDEKSLSCISSLFWAAVVVCCGSLRVVLRFPPLFPRCGQHALSRGVKGLKVETSGLLTEPQTESEPKTIWSKLVWFSPLESGQIWTWSCSSGLVVCCLRRHLAPTPLHHSTFGNNGDVSQNASKCTDPKCVEERCLFLTQTALNNPESSYSFPYTVSVSLYHVFTFLTKELSHASDTDLHVGYLC